MAAGDRFRHGADAQRQASRFVQPHHHPRRLREHAGRPHARLICSASAAAPAARAIPRSFRTNRRTSICRPNGITAGRAICRSAISTRMCRTSSPRRASTRRLSACARRSAVRATMRRWRRSGRTRRRTRSGIISATNYPEHRDRRSHRIIGVRYSFKACPKIRCSISRSPRRSTATRRRRSTAGSSRPAQLLGHRLRRDPQLHDRQRRREI